MLIDTHCHLPHNVLEAEKLIKSAAEEGVTKFITMGTSVADSVESIKLAGQIPQVYTTVGVYPHDDMSLSPDEISSRLETLLGTSKKIVGVGECGIDISNWNGGRDIKDQEKVFEIQIELALKNNLPVVIHNRNADEIVLGILQKYKDQNLRGVAHCFASTWEFAKKFLELNFYISFSGLITYPSRTDLAETVKNVPTDKFLVETDAPFLPPQGHRGEKNEPKYVKIVAQKVAEIKGLSLEEICNFSVNNANFIFKQTRS